MTIGIGCTVQDIEAASDPPVMVLVVEDEALIQLHVEQTLKEAGFQVAIAQSGGEAIAMLEDGANHSIRALLTDIDLGAGPNGWEVARRARELRPEMPVVYFTGGGIEEWSAHGVPNSILVAKPFVPAQLVVAVSQLMNAAPPSPAS